MSERPLVVVTDHLAEAGVERPVLENVAEVRLLQTGDENEVVRRGPDADVLLVYHDIKLTETGLAGLPRCKAVIRCGVGFDNVDLQAAGKRGIVVCNGPEEVADHALMMLLAIARRLLPADRAVREGTWTLSTIFGIPRLRGRTVG